MGISGFQDMGAGGASYEGVCQGINGAVTQWFKERPELIDEAVELGFEAFRAKYPEITKLIGSFNPSYAQAGYSYQYALHHVRGVQQ